MPSGPVRAADVLWEVPAVLAATGARAEGPHAGPITGLSIDTRTLAAGDLFVALQDQRDGHEFVTAAFERGASAALVSTDYARRPGDGLLLRVADPLQGLRAIARAARARLAMTARVIAVTGSAGKTGTTAMLRACLISQGSTHAPEKSFNNHWGVPLTLARMPAGTRFAVIEIGMNHAGEISPLTRLARPHIAIVTNVLPVHVGNFPDGEIGVAEAKAEVFEGLEPGGTAIVPRDSPHYERLAAAARDCGATVVTFGVSGSADVHPAAIEIEPDGSTVRLPSGETWQLGTPGQHIAVNSLAVAAALRVVAAGAGRGFSMGTALLGVAQVRAGAGRGEQGRYLVRNGAAVPPFEVLLIDESYNANPASMRAALAVLGRTRSGPGGRRIAVLGDMRELGDLGPALHAGLREAVDAAGADLVFACGPLMRGLFEAIAPDRRGEWREASTDLVEPFVAALRAGDVVMIKGSLGTNMAPLVRAIKAGGRAQDAADRT